LLHGEIAGGKNDRLRDMDVARIAPASQRSRKLDAHFAPLPDHKSIECLLATMMNSSPTSISS
jgi:hypothetical protein